jgi:hypothetical protein
MLLHLMLEFLQWKIKKQKESLIPSDAHRSQGIFPREEGLSTQAIRDQLSATLLI